MTLLLILERTLYIIPGFYVDFLFIGVVIFSFRFSLNESIITAVVLGTLKDVFTEVRFPIYIFSFFLTAFFTNYIKQRFEPTPLIKITYVSLVYMLYLLFVSLFANTIDIDFILRAFMQTTILFIFIDRFCEKWV